ncbi:MAG: eukaryotic-like serine/threonine-protein kinase [Gaiellales bacterium]|nr:eukaryotic-like serine/threonine-protein kinase [Gaiellales bacterium]
MAVVYMARQLDLDRYVALKELALLPTGTAALAGRFLREARLAGSLSHPNIVTVHEYFEHGGVPYIAMEYLERGSLRRYINRLSLGHMGGVLEGVLAGLDHASKRQIVHRDIKPENVMINADGRAKIADFGIATATNVVRSAASMTAPGTAVGTPNYMAPEQATARGVGPTTDIYAVGIMAFEMIVGRPPFSDTDDPIGVLTRQVMEPIPPVATLRPGVDPGISEWIERLTAKDPGRRPNAAAAWDELEERLISLLGPRWRRQSRLGAGNEGPPVMAAATTRTTQPLQRRPASRQNGNAAAYAPTVAPQTLSAGVQGSEAGSGGSRWKRLALGVALGIVAVGAGAAFAAQHAQQGVSAAQGGGGPPSTAQAPSTTQPAASPATAALASIPGDATSAKPSLDRKSLAKQQPIAKSLAQKYADAAVRVAALVSSGRSSPALDSLVASLRAVESAYRHAASAARTGDVAAYSAATAEIDASKNRVRQAITALNGQGQSGGNSSGTTPSQGTGSACSGDSTSDDPSDDQCAAP